VRLLKYILLAVKLSEKQKNTARQERQKKKKTLKSESSFGENRGIHRAAEAKPSTDNVAKRFHKTPEFQLCSSLRVLGRVPELLSAAAAELNTTVALTDDACRSVARCVFHVVGPHAESD